MRSIPIAMASVSGKRAWQGGSLGGIQWGPAADGEHAYVALSDIVRQLTPAGLQLDPPPGTACSHFA
jgi:hypothetical protein